MKVITVRQPWAWAIMHGGKDVENRPRNIVGSYRGRVAIHAGLALTGDYDTAKRMCDQLVPESEWDRPLHRGVVIGTVEIVDVHSHDECYMRDIRRLADLYATDREAFQQVPDRGCGGVAGRARMCSPWAMDEYQHIVLANPEPFDKPIPAKGKLGLWSWNEVAS